MSIRVIKMKDYSGRDVAGVRLECFDDEGHFYYTTEGSATRHPTDKPNPEIGQSLAFARALRNLANKLERRATGLTKHADDMRADKNRRALAKGFGKHPRYLTPGTRIQQIHGPTLTLKERKKDDSGWWLTNANSENCGGLNDKYFGEAGWQVVE